MNNTMEKFVLMLAQLDGLGAGYHRPEELQLPGDQLRTLI